METKNPVLWIAYRAKFFSHFVHSISTKIDALIEKIRTTIYNTVDQCVVQISSGCSCLNLVLNIHTRGKFHWVCEVRNLRTEDILVKDCRKSLRNTHGGVVVNVSLTSRRRRPWNKGWLKQRYFRTHTVILYLDICWHESGLSSTNL